ncbi:hypothetical protein HDK77DRAFT_498648 [Phyllosticta capitalensis]
MEDESAEPETVETETTRFDDTGDLRLILYKQLSEEAAPNVFIFIVSSKAMSMACGAWNSMLNGPFKEAQSTSGDWEIELPEDDPAALAVLLNIVHLRFDLVPDELGFALLLQITVLTDKYDITRLIRPWATSWFQAAQDIASTTKSGYEEWLWIAWELGQKNTFETLAAHLIQTVHVDADGRCLTKAGRLLDPCGSPQQHFPPGIIERVLEIRQKVISDLLKVYYDPLENFVKKRIAGLAMCEGTWQSSSCLQKCDELAFGSLCLVTKSVHELVSSLKKMSVQAYHEKAQANYYSPRRECTNYILTGQLLAAVEKVETSIPSAATEIHCNHLTRQAKKFGRT